LTSWTINGQDAAKSNHTATNVTLSYSFPPTNIKTVTDISIISQPNNLSYTHGDPLNLTGLVVRLTYDDNTTENIAASNFTANNITATPAPNNSLVRLTHHNQPVTITYGNLTQTTNVLTVNPKTITITGVSAVDRLYNGLTTVSLSGGTLVGVISGDVVSFTLGNGTIVNANTGNGKAVSTNIQLAGASAGNYTLTQPNGITVNILPTLSNDRIE
jgi:hypothetical protein